MVGDQNAVVVGGQKVAVEEPLDLVHVWVGVDFAPEGGDDQQNVQNENPSTRRLRRKAVCKLTRNRRPSPP